MQRSLTCLLASLAASAHAQYPVSRCASSCRSPPGGADRHRRADPRAEAQPSVWASRSSSTTAPARAAPSAPTSVAKAAPDGYTLLDGGVDLRDRSAVLQKTCPTTCSAISRRWRTIGLGAAHARHRIPALPAANLREFVALAKAKPGALHLCATTGLGSAPSHRARSSSATPGSTILIVSRTRAPAPRSPTSLGGQVSALADPLPCRRIRSTQRPARLQGAIAVTEPRALGVHARRADDGRVRVSPASRCSRGHGLWGPPGTAERTSSTRLDAEIKARARQSPRCRQKLAAQGFLAGERLHRAGRSLSYVKDEIDERTRRS